MLDPARPNPETFEALRWQEIQYGEIRKSLRRYTNMDDLCHALESAGAEYYAAIEDCPEVVELGLDVL